jgi:hypothetical protein
MFTGHADERSERSMAQEIVEGKEWTDVDGIAGYLEIYGSDEDPIFYHGKDTTPRALGYSEIGNVDSRRVRISYYGIKNDKHQLIRNGTLVGMLRDRMKLYVDRAKPKSKKIVKHCLTCKCG